MQKYGSPISNGKGVEYLGVWAAAAAHTPKYSEFIPLKTEEPEIL